MEADFTEEQLHFMKEALEEGKKAIDNNEIPVGCVFVNNTVNKKEIIGRGYNQTNLTRNGTRHAELVAIDDIILRQKEPITVFQNCELYVTCEPCIMCAAALAKLRINCVYFGCYNVRFGGNGSILNVHSDSIGDYKTYNVVPKLLENEAIVLFRDFYSRENRRAPEGKRKRKDIK